MVIYDKILPQILPQAENTELRENTMEELKFNFEESEETKAKKKDVITY